MIRRSSSGFLGEDLRRGNGRNHQQEAAKGVRIDPGADGAFIEDRAVNLAVADHAAHRVTEPSQAVENRFGGQIGQQPQHDPHRSRRRPAEYQGQRGAAQVIVIAHHINQHGDQREAEQHFNDTAQGARSQRGVTQAHQEGEQNPQRKADHNRGNGRRTE
jgi:hypothetical protein